MSVLSRDVAEHLPRWVEPSSVWQRRAACRGMDVETFFTGTGRYAAARATCRRCEVVEKCRRMADEAERGQPAAAMHGVFGGESPAERIARRRRDRM